MFLDEDTYHLIALPLAHLALINLEILDKITKRVKNYKEVDLTRNDFRDYSKGRRGN